MFNCFTAFLKAVAVVLCGPAETPAPHWNGPDAARTDDVAVLPWELERKSQLRGRRHYDKAHASIRARQRQRCHAPPVDFNPLTWGIALVCIDGVYQFVAFRLEKTFCGLYNVPNSWCDRAFLEKIQQCSAERTWLSWWFRPRQPESSLYYPSHGSPLLPALQSCRTLGQVATLLRFSFHHHALATVWLPWVTVGGSNSSVVLVQARGDGSMAVWVVRWSPRPSADPHPHSVRYRILGPPRRRPERQPRPLIYAPYTPSVLLEQRVMLASGEECGVLIYATWWSVEVLILSPEALALLPRRAADNGDLVCVPTVVCSSLVLPSVTCIQAVNGPHGPLAVFGGELEVFTSTDLTPPSWLTADAQHDEIYAFQCTFTAGVDVSVLVNVSARQLLLATTSQAPILLSYTADSPLAALVDLALSGAAVIDISVLLPTLATLFSHVDAHTATPPLTSSLLALPVSVPIVHPAGLIKPLAFHVEALACGAPFPVRPLRLDCSGSMPVVCVPRLRGLFMDEGLRTLAMQPADVPAPLILPTMTIPTPLKEVRPSSPKPQKAAPRVAITIEAPTLPKPTSAPVRKQTAAPRLHNILPRLPVQPLIVARATQHREVTVEQYFKVTKPKEKEDKEQTGADLNSATFQMALKAAQRAGVKKEATSPSHVVQKDDASAPMEITLVAPQASNNTPSLHKPRSPTISRRASTLSYPDMDASMSGLAQPQAESRRRSANFEMDLQALRDSSLPIGHVDNLVLSANQARRLPSPSSLHLPRTPPSPCTVQDTSDSCPSTPTPPSSQTASSSSPSTSSPRTAAAHVEATSHSTGSSISAAVSDTGSEIDEDCDPSDDGIRLPEAPLSSPALRREDLFPSLTNPTFSRFTSAELRTIACRSQLHKEMPNIAHDGKLGSGGFSWVVKVGPNQGYDQAYALKLTHVGKAYKDNGWRLFNMLDLQKESRILARLSSVQPSVVVGQVAWGFGGPGDCLLLSLMELAEGGTLHEYKNLLPLEGACYVFVTLLHAVRVLSEHGILPYDIKPQNVLLMANGEPRLCDLNIAVEVDNPPSFDDKAKYAFGTDDFQSPERKLGLSLDVRGDLYSLAVTMRWAVPGRWPKFPKCIKRCADRDITKRPTLEQLLADPSVQAVDISHVHPQVVAMIAKRRADEAEQLRLDEEIEAQALLDQQDKEVGHASTSSSDASLATAGSGPTAAGKVCRSPSPLRELLDRDLGYEDLFCSGLHNSTVELVADAELLGLSDAALNASAHLRLGSLQSLGSGSVASVLLVGPAQGYKGTFALKVVRLSSLVRQMGREEVGAMELQREFILLAQAATASKTLPIVVQYGWAVMREAGLLVSLMEVAEAGDMSCFKGMLKYDEVCYVGRQLLEALHWLLTDMGFEYCDMKPDNVLCKADGRVRLGDLNAALSVTASREQRRFRGSGDYRAPEIQSNNNDFISNDGRADVFSWAKVLLFVASSPLSELGQCLNEVNHRPTFSDLLCQGWLRYAPTTPPKSFVDKAKARAIKLGRYKPAEPPSPFTDIATGTQDMGPLSVGPSAWARPSVTTASPLWGQASSAPLADWDNTLSLHQPAVEEMLPSFLVGPSMGLQEQLDVGTDMGDVGLGIGNGSLLLSSLLGGDDHGAEEEEEEEDGKAGKRRSGQGLWGLGDDHPSFFHKKDDDDDDAGAGGAVGGGASRGGITSGNVFGQQWGNWGNGQQGSSTWATQGQRGGGSQARDALPWATGFGTSRIDDGDFLAGITSHVLFEGEKNSGKPDKLGCAELFYGCSIPNDVVAMRPTALHTTHPGDRTDDCPNIHCIKTLGAGVFSSVYLVGPGQGYDRVLALKVSDLRALNCMRYQEEVLWLQNESRLLAVIREDAEMQSYVPEQVGWTVYWPGSLLVNLLELAEGGSLETYAEALDEEALRYVLRRLVKALDLLLLRHKIEHCDVKPGNSLVMRDGRVLLADFNCALPITDGRCMRVQRGDQNWRAPETTQVLFTDINGCKISPPNVTADGRADVYSLGKMVPFLLKPLHTLSAAGQACHRSMMATEAVDRPTFAQLLEGEWLGGAPIEPPMSWTTLVDEQVTAFEKDLAERLAEESVV